MCSFSCSSVQDTISQILYCLNNEIKFFKGDHVTKCSKLSLAIYNANVKTPIFEGQYFFKKNVLKHVYPTVSGSSRWLAIMVYHF